MKLEKDRRRQIAGLSSTVGPRSDDCKYNSSVHYTTSTSLKREALACVFSAPENL